MEGMSGNMNKRKRAVINEKVIPLLNGILDTLSTIIDSEQDSIDNIPDNLRSSERFDNMESVLEEIEDITDRKSHV